MRAFPKTRVVLINIIVMAFLFELFLRVQQRIGPMFNLEHGPGTLAIAVSDELNHEPVLGTDWSRGGLRTMEKENSKDCSRRLLFMGDSFMESVRRTPAGDIAISLPSDTIPVHVRRFFKEALSQDVCVFNAGYSSYSPSIFVPQAKKLIPLMKPDIVVIDVDETDLWDDFYRYRDLATRDTSGSITAVRPTPVYVQFNQGLVASTSKTLYVHRVFSKLYFTRVTFPELLARYNERRPNDNLFLAKIPAAEARGNHALEIEYFKSTLEDLTQTVVARMGSPQRLIYIHHPHLGHFGTAGVRLNNVASEVVSEVASGNNVSYYDATEDLRAEFGETPDTYYIPGDIHFNAAGTRAYGIAVAKYLAQVLGNN